MERAHVRDPPGRARREAVALAGPERLRLELRPARGGDVVVDVVVVRPGDLLADRDGRGAWRELEIAHRYRSRCGGRLRGAGPAARRVGGRAAARGSQRERAGHRESDQIPRHGPYFTVNFTDADAPALLWSLLASATFRVCLPLGRPL